MPHHNPEPHRDRDYEAEQRRARFVGTWRAHPAPAAPTGASHRGCSGCRHQYVDTLGDVPVMTCDRLRVTCEAARAKGGKCGPAGMLWQSLRG